MVLKGNRDMGLLLADTALTNEENMEIRFSMGMMDDEQSGFKWWRTQIDQVFECPRDPLLFQT